MATVGTLFPTTTDSSATTGSTASSSSSAGQSDPLANQSAFLHLLVAQMQYQDPTQPVDGTTFVTQLAEFAGVQQDVAMRGDLDQISGKYVGTNSLTSSTGATDSTAGNSSSSSTAAGANGTTAADSTAKS